MSVVVVVSGLLSPFLPVGGSVGLPRNAKYIASPATTTQIITKSARWSLINFFIVLKIKSYTVAKLMTMKMAMSRLCTIMYDNAR